MEIIYQNRYGNFIRSSPTHIYIKPHPALRQIVAHYTLCIGNASLKSIPIQPLMLIPDASGCFVSSYDGLSMDTYVYGATTKTITVQNDLQIFPLRFFVEFFPGGLIHFIRENQQNMINLKIPLCQVNPELACKIEETAYSSKDLDEFIQSIDFLLLSYLHKREQEGIVVPSIVPHCLKTVRQLNGKISMPQLAHLANYSSRQIDRIFHNYLGMTPKSYSKIIRINRIVQSLPSSNKSLSQLAQDAGYFDQSHFTREFKTICQSTPTQYLSSISKFYNEPLKL